MWHTFNGSANQYPEVEMRAAFEAVQDEKNWKNPIPERTVSVDKLGVVVAAIAFYAGSPTYGKLEPNGCFTIKAPGYYACVGA